MDNSFHTRPFTFDRVFPLAEANVPDNPVDMALKLAALSAELDVVRASSAAAVAVARSEGYEAGINEARAERDTALLSAIDALHASIEEIDASQTAAIEILRREAASVAMTAAEVMAGRALDLAPAQAIDDAIGRVLLQIARGQEVVIRVHPDMVGDVEARIADRQSRDRRKLALLVVADPAVAIGDAQMFWDTGGLELDAEARRQAVVAEVAPLLALPAPSAGDAPNASPGDEENFA